MELSPSEPLNPFLIVALRALSGFFQAPQGAFATVPQNCRPPFVTNGVQPLENEEVVVDDCGEDEAEAGEGEEWVTT